MNITELRLLGFKSFVDPARAPMRVMTVEEFARRWEAADRWMAVILPGDRAPVADAPPPVTPPAETPCDDLVAAGVSQARSNDLTAAERTERLRQLLDELGIAKVAKSKALALSGGERRRLEITRALVISPMFMLLDEPFAGIDPIAVVDIQGIVSQLQRRGIGVLITDDNVRETLGICDRAYIVNEGTVLEEGTSTQIADSPRARQIYLGEPFRL